MQHLRSGPRTVITNIIKSWLHFIKPNYRRLFTSFDQAIFDKNTIFLLRELWDNYERDVGTVTS